MMALLYIYCYMNNLVDPNFANVQNTGVFIIPDAFFFTMFGGNIPAFKYLYRDDQNINRRIPMQDAVNQGLIDEPMNTFQVMQNVDPNFNPNRFPIDDFFEIVYLNSQDEEDLPELTELIDDEKFSDALIDELMIARDMLDIVTYLLTYKMVGQVLPEFDKITFTEIVQVSANFGRNDLVDRLLTDPRSNKLIYAIINYDIDYVRQWVNQVDPRDNNFEAYQLAVQGDDQIIIDIVRAAIIERNQLEQQTFQTMMLPLGSLDQPPLGLQSYSRTLINK
jgi:hypothetical protein